MNSPERIEAYRHVLKRHNIDPTDMTYSGGEDAGEFLSGERLIRRFCAVTRGSELGLMYAVPDYDDMESAQQNSAEYIEDPEYAEIPVEIADLDTSERFEPEITILWHKQNPAN